MGTKGNKFPCPSEIGLGKIEWLEWNKQINHLYCREMVAEQPNWWGFCYSHLMLVHTMYCSEWGEIIFRASNMGAKEIRFACPSYIDWDEIEWLEWNKWIGG